MYEVKGIIDADGVKDIKNDAEVIVKVRGQDLKRIHSIMTSYEKSKVHKRKVAQKKTGVEPRDLLRIEIEIMTIKNL